MSRPRVSNSWLTRSPAATTMSTTTSCCALECTARKSPIWTTAPDHEQPGEPAAVKAEVVDE